MSATATGSARPHGKSPYLTALELVTARPAREPDTGRMGLRFKQNAKGDWLVEELDLRQREGETDAGFLERCLSTKEIVAEMVALYAPEPEHAEGWDAKIAAAGDTFERGVRAGKAAVKP